MKKTTTLFALSILLLSSCINQDDFSGSSKTLEEDLNDQLVTYTNSFDEIPGAWLYLDLPNDQIIDLISGVSELETQTPLADDQLIRVASISKMFTAATILLIQEEGKLSISDPIEDYLDQGLAGLHEPTLLSSITVEMLLNHTSGIENYTELDWIATLQTNPFRVWEPQDLINHVANFGQPRFNPGVNYYYSDTNYVLLGLIIEQITQTPLHEAYMHYILEPLAMNNTYLEAYEDFNRNSLANGYFEQTNLSDWNTSSDWGGGGLVSTMEDLALFMRGITSDLFQNKSTYQSMQDWIATGPQSDYGLGIGQFDTGSAVLIGHGGQGFGFTSGLYYYPDKDIVIGLAVNQQATTIDEFERSVLSTINRYY